MWNASEAYIQEEQRQRGARPRIRVVLTPFDLDTGLAPGLGEYEATEYGGEPGKISLGAGYITSGSWTSPLMQSHLQPENGGPAAGSGARATLQWESRTDYLEPEITWRSGATYQDVMQAPYRTLQPEGSMELGAYYQIKVAFGGGLRAWAVDAGPEADGFTAWAVDAAGGGGYDGFACAGEFPGGVAGMMLTGEVHLPEGDIVHLGDMVSWRDLDFGALPVGSTSLVLDNRRRQWVPGAGQFPLQTIPWFKKYLKIYHGFELPGGQVEWQEVYLGQVERITAMAHGWEGGHTVRLESVDLVASLLERRIGTPAEDGRRQPFMRGAYRARAELLASQEPSCQVTKTGSGAATLGVVDQTAFAGRQDTVYRVEAETTGEIGVVTFRWSKDQGHSWQGTGIVTASSIAPVELEENLKIYWTGGLGNDLVAGDCWDLAARAKVLTYGIPGAPFAAVTDVLVNGERIGPGVQVEAVQGEIYLTGGSGEVAARVVKDATSHPIDIIGDILQEAGLGAYIEADSFARARSDTLEYAVGVCFENMTAGEAIRHLVERCLYDFWVEGGVIKLKAYLGDEAAL